MTKLAMAAADAASPQSSDSMDEIMTSPPPRLNQEFLDSQLKTIIHDFLFTRTPSDLKSSSSSSPSSSPRHQHNSRLHRSKRYRGMWLTAARSVIINKKRYASEAQIYPDSISDEFLSPSTSKSRFSFTESELRPCNDGLATRLFTQTNAQDSNSNPPATPPRFADYELHVRNGDYQQQGPNDVKISIGSPLKHENGVALEHGNSCPPQQNEEASPPNACEKLGHARLGNNFIIDVSTDARSKCQISKTKYSCRKPPRPPRSTSFRSNSFRAVRLRSASRRVMLESSRMKKRKAQKSSTSKASSILAFIFTVAFLLIMLFQGFVGHNRYADVASEFKPSVSLPNGTSPTNLSV